MTPGASLADTKFDSDNQFGPWHTARVNDGDAIDASVVTECDRVFLAPVVVESYPGLPVCDDCSYLRLVRGDTPGDNAFLRFLNDGGAG